MPKQVQIRRGTTVEHAAFRGKQGELTMNTNTNRLHVHDGATYAGHPQALEAEVCKRANNLSDLASASGARTNLGVFSKDESYNINKTRTRSNGLYFIGQNNTARAYCALGSYAIGTQGFTLRVQFRVPTTNSLLRTVAFLGSSHSAAAANGFALLLNSGALQVRLYGGSTADYVYQEYADLIANYAGQLVEVAVVRSFSGLTVYLNGLPVVLGASATVGAGSTFLATVTSAYLVLGAGIMNPFIGEVYGLTLFNYPMSADQVASLNREGVSAADTFATDTQLISSTVNRDFSGANNWVNDTLSAFNATGDLSLTATGSGQEALLAGAYFGTVAPGYRYQVICEVANLAGTTFTLQEGGYANEMGTISSNGKFHGVFVSEAAVFGGMRVTANGAGSVDMDNFSLKRAGAMVNLDFDALTLYQVPDRSGNRCHALVTVGVMWLEDYDSGVVRGRTNTNGNQQLLGYNCLPANARIRSISVTSDGSGTAVTSVNIGTASGGSQVASAVPIVTGRNDVGTFVSRFASSGALWMGANGSSNLDWTVCFDLVE